MGGSFSDLLENDRVSNSNYAIVQDCRFQTASVFQSAEDARNLGNLLQVAAGFKESEATHDDATDCKFAVDQVNERHAAGDDITAGFIGEHFRAELSRGEFESFLLDEGYGFVRPLGFKPRIAKETVSFETTVGEGLYLGYGDHRT